VHPEEHQRAAADLDGVADQHHPPLGHRVGEGADKRGQRHVGNREEELQERLVFLRRLHLPQHVDGGNQQGIVGERRRTARP
jgi:hypothetical protein